MRAPLCLKGAHVRFRPECRGDHHKGYYNVTDNDLIEESVVPHFSSDKLGSRRMVTVHVHQGFRGHLADVGW